VYVRGALNGDETHTDALFAIDKCISLEGCACVFPQAQKSLLRLVRSATFAQTVQQKKQWERWLAGKKQET